MLERQVLVLNQNYEPLSVCTARRALLLLFTDKAQLVEAHELEVRTVSRVFPLPCIVRLTLYVKVPHKKVVLSKRNVMKRDKHSCQYCGATQGPMTIDHVVPRNLGGTDTWENLVCACVKCNNKKGDSAPEEADLRLSRRPTKPHYISFIRHFLGVVDRRWRPYLFME